MKISPLLENFSNFDILNGKFSKQIAALTTRNEMSDLLFASSEPQTTYKIRGLLKQQLIRKIMPRVYSFDLTSSVETIVRQHVLQILGTLFPGCMLNFRTALEVEPSPAGRLYVTYKYTKKILLPGVEIRFIQGKQPTVYDNMLFEGLYCASKERALLENLIPSRFRDSESRNLSQPEIKKRLEAILINGGANALNNFRDRAKTIASELDYPEQYKQLSKLISAMLQTTDSRVLASDLARARAVGEPYDSKRLLLFESLFKALYQGEFPELKSSSSIRQYKNIAFFEAYFSNYIEGTVFEVEEAEQIIKDGKPNLNRLNDSHDILGTYEVVSDSNEMQITPNNAEELLTLLKYRHAKMLASRSDKHPGEFKLVNNRAGLISFVDFTMVTGTLKKAFSLYNSLKFGFARAAFIKFLISEIHPFDDGNGRIARIMMNSELVKVGESKIIIPTVFREDYILTLKKLSNTGNPGPYIDMLLKAYRFTATAYMEEHRDVYNYFKLHNCFEEPNSGKHLLFE